MTVFTFASAKGSPGVTTTVLALAISWPGEAPVTIVEADPAGGDLATWLERPLQPGLVSLAAAGRRELSRQLFDVHTQALPGSDRVSVLVGPLVPEQAAAALGSLRGRIGKAFDERGGVVLVDCGRLDPGSPAESIFLDADGSYVLCRPGVAAVHHVQARLPSMSGGNPQLVSVGDEPYPLQDMAQAAGIAPAGTIAFDARAAAALGDGQRLGRRALDRSPLVRAARTLAVSLDAAHGSGSAVPAVIATDEHALVAPAPAPPLAGGRVDLPPPPPAPPPPGPAAPPPPPSASGPAGVRQPDPHPPAPPTHHQV